MVWIYSGVPLCGDEASVVICLYLKLQQSHRTVNSFYSFGQKLKQFDAARVQVWRVNL